MKRRMANRGFTLIELLVVMGLMALLTAMVFSNSFGMSQATSYTAAQDTVFNVLQMAHQRACIDGKDVYVHLINPDPTIAPQDSPRLAIIEGYGRISRGYESGTYPRQKELNEKNKREHTHINVTGFFVDNGYSLSRSEEDETDIYNFDSGDRAKLVGVIYGDSSRESLPVPDINISGGNRIPEEDGFYFEHRIRQLWLAPSESGSISQSKWETGDMYGFAIMPDQRLPKGFTATVKEGIDTICFYADGSSGAINFTAGQGRTKNHGKATIQLAMTIDKDAGDRAKKRMIEIVVSGGDITVKSSAKK